MIGFALIVFVTFIHSKLPRLNLNYQARLNEGAHEMIKENLLKFGLFVYVVWKRD